MIIYVMISPTTNDETEILIRLFTVAAVFIMLSSGEGSGAMRNVPVNVGKRFLQRKTWNSSRHQYRHPVPAFDAVPCHWPFGLRVLVV